MITETRSGHSLVAIQPWPCFFFKLLRFLCFFVCFVMINWLTRIIKLWSEIRLIDQSIDVSEKAWSSARPTRVTFKGMATSSLLLASRSSKRPWKGAGESPHPPAPIIAEVIILYHIQSLHCMEIYHIYVNIDYLTKNSYL